MLITDAMIYEGQFAGDDGTDYYFADFIDGSEDALPFTASVPSTFAVYEPATDDGVSHCYDLDRSEALDQFLEQIVGKFRIEITAWKEVCVSGWWADVNSISFSDEVDRDLFVLRFGK